MKLILGDDGCEEVEEEQSWEKRTVDLMLSGKNRKVYSLPLCKNAISEREGRREQHLGPAGALLLWKEKVRRHNLK